MRLSLVSTGKVSLLLGPFSEGLQSFQFSDDGMLLLLCCGDGSCHILCGRSAALFLSIRSPLPSQPSSSIGHALQWTQASFSPDCRQILFLSGGSSIVHLHSLQTSCLQTPYKLSQKSVFLSKMPNNCFFFLPMPPQARFILCRGLQEVSGLWTLLQLLCIDNIRLVG